MSTFDDSRIKPKQMRVLLALTCGETDEVVAKACKISLSSLYRLKKNPQIVAELERMLAWQRDHAQALMHNRLDRAVAATDDAFGAVDADGQPMHGVRLRAAELVGSLFERLSKRESTSLPPTSGPLIVLPPGSTRIALMVDSSAQPAPELPAAPIETTATVVEQPQPASQPAPAGLPRWWRDPTTPR